MKNELYHYGTPRHSGRYPWGSGENPYQRTKQFMGTYQKLKDEGLTDAEIRTQMGINTSEFRKQISIANYERQNYVTARVMALKAKGYSNVKIGYMMNMPEGTVRDVIKRANSEKTKSLDNTADLIKKEFANGKRFLDVGSGVERVLGVKETKLKTVLEMMEAEGYRTINIQVKQLGTNHKTTVKVLVPPGTVDENGKTDEQIYKALYKEVITNIGDIKSVGDYVQYDSKGELTDLGMHKPESLSSSRLKVVYNEDGGGEKDGVIEIRKGVEDISLGDNCHYAQVRIAVDGTHYLKGMAMYADDDKFPDGVDVIFNTSKKAGTPVMGSKDNTVLKNLKDNPDNPFGATIKPMEKGGQRWYEDENGEQKLSVINKVNAEGDWGEWSKTLASQMLSKQSPQLISRQLKISVADKKEELAEINKITDPVLKKKMLDEYQSDCDSSAVHLKAAALPRQTSKVLLPIESLKNDEIYAPGYKQGEEVVLVRYPHGGTFEIPRLRVNNKNAEAKSTLGNAIDAVGINGNVAQRLSGADFDGDTALVIPVNDRVKITTSEPLSGLIGWADELKEVYHEVPGMVKMDARSKQLEMGKVSNLITDMTLKGADPDELERAVKHSMVVIDAEKHVLNYKQSEIDNGITALKYKYQGTAPNGQPAGASTLISKAKSEERVNERSQYQKIDPETGKFLDSTKWQKNADGTYKLDAEGNKMPMTHLKYIQEKDENGNKKYDENGKPVWKKDKDGNPVTKVVKNSQKSTKMAETEDAFTLVSKERTRPELIYAEYANTLKTMAREARKAEMTLPEYNYSPTAAEKYAKEVESLKNQLDVALMNAPKERQAQIYANVVVESKIDENPSAEEDTKKKWRAQALEAARTKFDAHKTKVHISDSEWEAIQAGALKKTTLEKIYNNTDSDELKQRAMPRQTTNLSSSVIAQIKARSNGGWTIEEIADDLGISTSTVSNYLSGKKAS